MQVGMTARKCATVRVAATLGTLTLALAGCGGSSKPGGGGSSGSSVNANTVALSVAREGQWLIRNDNNNNDNGTSIVGQSCQPFTLQATVASARAEQANCALTINVDGQTNYMFVGHVVLQGAAWMFSADPSANPDIPGASNTIGGGFPAGNNELGFSGAVGQPPGPSPQDTPP